MTEPKTNPNANTRIPTHHVHQLIGRMTADPELKEALTKKLISHDHNQGITLSYMEEVFSQLKFERAGSRDAFHLDQLHKTLTQHVASNTFGPSTPNHPLLHG